MQQGHEKMATRRWPREDGANTVMMNHFRTAPGQHVSQRPATLGEIQESLGQPSLANERWGYYRLTPGRCFVRKTKPIQFEEFADCLKWFKLKKRKETDQAWKVDAKDLIELDDDGNVVSVNLDVKNPNSAEALEHLPPEQLVADILKKEHRIIEIMEEIQGVLKGGA